MGKPVIWKGNRDASIGPRTGCRLTATCLLGSGNGSARCRTRPAGTFTAWKIITGPPRAGAAITTTVGVAIPIPAGVAMIPDTIAGMPTRTITAVGTREIMVAKTMTAVGIEEMLVGKARTVTGTEGITLGRVITAVGTGEITVGMAITP